MRKMILFLCCVCLSQLITAQRSSGFISENRLLREAEYMFEDGNYAGCTDKIIQYKKFAKDKDFLKEADYLLVASAYYQNTDGVLLDLKEYLDTYPQSVHGNEITFMIALMHFAEKDYIKAIYWFNQSDLDYLSDQQQEEYAYRMGISCLETNRLDEAKRLFGLLSANSTTYRGAATYYTGYLHYREGDYNQAMSYFNQIKNDPDFKEDVQYHIAQINFTQKRYTQTISDGKELLSRYPQNSSNKELNRIIGLSYFYEGDYPQTITYMEKALSASQEFSREDYYSLGLANYSEKQYSQAIKYLSASNPGNDALGQSTYLYLGQSYLQQKESREALMAFQSASRMDFDPEAKEAAMYNYAMLLHQNSVSPFGESVTVLEDFLNLYPNSIYADQVNDALIDVYLTTKNYDTALASIAKIKQPGAKIQEARQKIYYYKGTVNFTNADYDTAITNFTQAANAGNYARTEKNEALFWRAETYYKKEDYVKAAADYQAFLATGPTSELAGLAQYGLAYCRFNQKQYTQAESEFLKYIRSASKDSPNVADAYARLGDCYFYNRQFDKAESAYNQAVSILPSMGAYALFQKGYVMGLQKDYRGKIAQMDKIINEYPQSPYVIDALYEKGRSYVLLDNTSAAIETYQTLWNKYPDSENARKAGLQIGMLYFNSNQSQKSAEAYKKVIAQYPGSQEAKVAAQDLKSVYFDLNDVGGYAEYIRSLGGAVKFEASEQDSLTFLAAERFFVRGNKAQAQESLIKYLQTFPAGAFSNNAHYYLANIYYDNKDFVKAKQEYQEILNAGNNQFTEEAIARMAEMEYNDRNYQAAMNLYERLLGIANTKVNQNVASLGLLRSATQMSSYTKMITSANTLLKDESLEPGVATEARYYRAKACLALGENNQAVSDLTELSKDTRTAFGAEAKYLLAQHYFNTGQSAKAKEIVMNYIQQGTPHAYWLARSFILLSDIFESEGDKLQARQYLESLQNSYTNTQDDIHSMINERLTKLN